MRLNNAISGKWSMGLRRAPIFCSKPRSRRRSASSRTSQRSSSVRKACRVLQVVQQAPGRGHQHRDAPPQPRLLLSAVLAAVHAAANLHHTGSVSPACRRINHASTMVHSVTCMATFAKLLKSPLLRHVRGQGIALQAAATSPASMAGPASESACAPARCSAGRVG